jgi:hypothetical protein
MKILDLYENKDIDEGGADWFLNFLINKSLGGGNVGVNLNKKGAGISFGKGGLGISSPNIVKWGKDKKSDNTTKTGKYDKKNKKGKN